MLLAVKVEEKNKPLKFHEYFTATTHSDFIRKYIALNILLRYEIFKR